MSMPQTESTDMKTWEEHIGWVLRTPLNVPVMVVDTPALFMGLRSVELEEGIPSDFGLVSIGRQRRIDIATHQALIDESLREYSNIWRSLAKK